SVCAAAYVNVAIVLTAGPFMKRAQTVAVHWRPNVPLKLIKNDGISTVYVVDKKQKLLGYVTADQAAAAAKEGKGLEEILTSDIPTVHPETLLSDLFEPMSDDKAPLSVVDDSDRKSTRLNSSHVSISYAVFCLQK